MPNTTIVPAGKLVNIPCKVNFSSTTKNISTLFETEQTELSEGLETVKHGIILQKNTNAGRIYQILTITLLQAQECHKVQVQEPHAVVSTVANEMKSEKNTEALSDIKTKEHQRKVLDQIDLSGLNPNQMKMVEHMLTSTCMDIKLYDNTPAQLNYHSVPKPLYAEFKAQIGDLNKQRLDYQPNISLFISSSIG